MTDSKKKKKMDDESEMTTTVRVNRQAWKEFRRKCLDDDLSLEEGLDKSIRSFTKGTEQTYTKGEMMRVPRELHRFFETLIMYYRQSGKAGLKEIVGDIRRGGEEERLREDNPGWTKSGEE